VLETSVCGQLIAVVLRCATTERKYAKELKLNVKVNQQNKLNNIEQKF